MGDILSKNTTKRAERVCLGGKGGGGGGRGGEGGTKTNVGGVCRLAAW